MRRQEGRKEGRKEGKMDGRKAGRKERKGMVLSRLWLSPSLFFG
jgi:predicted transposase YdaD